MESTEKSHPLSLKQLVSQVAGYFMESIKKIFSALCKIMSDTYTKGVTWRSFCKMSPLTESTEKSSLMMDIITVSGATDMWQPVDALLGYLVKKLIGKAQDKWLELDDNIDTWLGNNEQD